MRFPVDCTLGADCFIQQYVDRDPGPGAKDFTCGPLSYNGHSGTDFALFDLVSMNDGVAVLSAASGVVTGIREGEPDMGLAGMKPGKECGNGVVIDHGDGWVTQYCHLKNGTIRVKAGDVIKTGTPLGEIGLSGQTEFPHLDFSLRRNGQVVDPFDGDAGPACALGSSPLWSQTMPYTPGGLLALNVSSSVPEFDAVKDGRVAPLSPVTDTPALVLYTHMFGTQAGDRLTLNLTHMTDQAVTVFEHKFTLDRTQARSFRAFGMKSPIGGWPSGSYAGHATLRRGTSVVSEKTIHFSVR